MTWKVLTVLACAFLGLTGLSTQEKEGATSASIVAARQASMDMSSITFRSMGDAMKLGRDAKTQAYPAAALVKWAKAVPGMFPPGTGKGEAPAETQALNAIWQDRAGFDQAAASYGDAAATLAALAAANDTAGFTKQLDRVNDACNACHSRYKSGAQGPPKK
jgi:cytochrome c556